MTRDVNAPAVLWTVTSSIVIALPSTVESLAMTCNPVAAATAWVATSAPST